MSAEHGNPKLELLTESEREVFARCDYLGGILSACVVDSDYKPPIQFTSAIALTAKGSRLANQVKGSGIELREAQVACFIELLSGGDLLVNVREIDLAPIVAAISSEIRRNKIRFAWVYGRAMYDAVAKSGLHNHPFLTNRETKRLLEGTPQGVFQHGPYVTGPFGLLESPEWRKINSSRQIPGFHCNELDCHAVHPIFLSTHKVGVSKAEDLLEEKLDKSADITDYVSEVFNSVSIKRQPPYRWLNNDNLPFFLLDSFSTSDLKKLVVELLDRTGGALRAACESQLPDESIKSATEWVSSKSDAELMQVLLLARDEDIHALLNGLVWTEGIEIPEGEVRSAKIMSEGAGPLSMELEASHHGVRHRPPNELLQLRLRNIVHAVYSIEDKKDQEKLAWLLRSHEGESGPARLVSALSREDPVSLVKKLLITDEATYRKVLRELGLPAGYHDNRSDDEIAALLAWHIGFPEEHSSQELKAVRENLVRLRQTTQALPSDLLDSSDIDALRGVGGKLFPAIEKALKRALRFAVWALVRDHYMQGQLMVYTPSRAENFCDDWLANRASSLEKSHTRDMRLGDLCECFGILSSFLRDIVNAENLHTRPSDDLPKRVRLWGSPFKFPFQHIYPYLDLDRRSRVQLLESISRVASDLQAEKVLVVRNAFAHDSHDVPGREDVLRALAAVEQRLGELVVNGLYPLSSRNIGSESDALGRRKVTMRNSEGFEVVLVRPTGMDLSAFPFMDDGQVILSGARLVASNEPLRFRYQHDSDYTAKWQDFPVRAVVRKRALSRLTAPVEEGE